MPGKLRAVEKWELPPTVTTLRSFLGFCNFYLAFLQGFSEMASTLLKLKVGRVDGKKGSKFQLTWSEDEKLAFETLKRAMLKQMSLQVVNSCMVIYVVNGCLGMRH